MILARKLLVGDRAMALILDTLNPAKAREAQRPAGHDESVPSCGETPRG